MADGGIFEYFRFENSGDGVRAPIGVTPAHDEARSNAIEDGEVDADQEHVSFYKDIVDVFDNNEQGGVEDGDEDNFEEVFFAHEDVGQDEGYHGKEVVDVTIVDVGDFFDDEG